MKSIECLPVEVDAVLCMYGIPMNFEAYDNSKSNQDIRIVLFVDITGVGKIVIKIVKNSFTTPERVSQWARLASHYDTLGIYAPQFLANINSEYAFMLGEYCVYAEEFAKFLPDESINEEQSAEVRLNLLGRVASHPTPLVRWAAPYAMYDKFDANDEAPEIYDNGLQIIRGISQRFPEYDGRSNQILHKYECLRSDFEEVYSRLPKAVFQADMNRSNLLYDEGRFVGLLDFNLSGTEVILAYSFYESYRYLDESEFEAIKHGAVNVPCVEYRLRRNFNYIACEYSFSDEERKAFGQYFNLAVPFWGAHIVAYHKLIRDYGNLYITKILDFIEFQMNRRDVDDWLFVMTPC